MSNECNDNSRGVRGSFHSRDFWNDIHNELSSPFASPRCRYRIMRFPASSFIACSYPVLRPCKRTSDPNSSFDVKFWPTLSTASYKKSSCDTLNHFTYWSARTLPSSIATSVRCFRHFHQHLLGLRHQSPPHTECKFLLHQEQQSPPVRLFRHLFLNKRFHQRIETRQSQNQNQLSHC